MATYALGTEPLDTMGIVIGSPPEIDNQKSSSIDKSDTQENENFLTPPESYIPSSSSSQEDRQRLRPLAPGHAKGSVSVVAETMFDADDGRCSDGKCWDSVNDVGGIGRFQCELKRFRTSNIELDKPTSKKIRGLDHGMDSEINNMNDNKIIDLDTEEINEEIQFDTGKTVDVDTPGVARDRQDLPPPIRGNEEDKLVGESSRYVKVKKASWTDIVNALEVIFGKEDDGSEDIDLLEAVKRRGLTFPKPRWL